MINPLRLQEGLKLFLKHTIVYNYKDTWLAVPKMYFNLEPQEQDAVWEWGCGPGDGIGDYIVPDTIYGLNVRKACGPHDLGYRKSPREIEWKYCADIRFLINLVLIIIQHSGKLLIIPRFYRAMSYFWAVLLAGNSAFDDVED